MINIRQLVYIAWMLLCFTACNEKAGIRYSDQEIMRILAIDETQFQEAKRIGLIIDRDSLCPIVRVENALGTASYSSHLEEENWQPLLREFAYLYEHFGDNIGKAEAYRPYSFSAMDSLMKEIGRGNFIPQCADISAISSHFLKGQLSDYEWSEVEITTVEHTLNFVCTQLDSIEYCFFMDVQNGFIFPSLDQTTLKIPSIQEIQLNKSQDYCFYWLPATILSRKRNYTSEIMPCTVFPQFGAHYFRSPEGSKYPYLILGESFHKILWFDLGQMNQNALKQELILNLITDVQ